MDSSVLLLTSRSSLCQRPSCTLLFTAFMKLKLLYTFGDGKSRKNFQGGRDLNEELGMRNEGGGFAEIDEEVVAVLAFVISHTTFLAAQDDETGRCPKVC